MTNDDDKAMVEHVMRVIGDPEALRRAVADDIRMRQNRMTLPKELQETISELERKEDEELLARLGREVSRLDATPKPPTHSEGVPVKNAANLATYRRDIEKATKRSLPPDQDNRAFISRLFGVDLQYLESLGVLNRGFCPFCGDGPIDQSYWRANHFTSVKVYLCKDCWTRTHPDAALNDRLAKFSLANPDDRRILPSVLILLAFRHIKIVLAVLAIIVVWFVSRK